MATRCWRGHFAAHGGAIALALIVLSSFSLPAAQSQSTGGVYGDYGETRPDHPCDPDRHAHMKAFFSKIVLVIHFNYAWVAVKSVGFWLRIYKPLFEHIVLIADEAIPELNIEERSPPKWARNWRMCYAYLPKFMERYPDAEGFLWTNDDVVINYWNLVKADKTKLWLPNNDTDFDTRWFPLHLGSPSKWPTDWGGFKGSQITMGRAMNLLNFTQVYQYRRHIRPFVNKYPKRICDVFYVPRRHVEQFSKSLIPICLEARAPSELCIPWAFYVLDHPRRFDHVLDNMIYRWDQWQSKTTGNKQLGLRYFPQKFWQPRAAAFHPWKIARGGSQLVLLQLLKGWDPCIQ